MQSSKQPTIHQFAIDATPGDGITNGMLLTRKLLRLAGIHSDIYCAQIPPAFQGDILPMQAYTPASADALLIHHGIGNDHEQWLRQLPEAKFMVFHNITPGELFPPEHPIQPMLAFGRQQLTTWKDWLAGAIADSRQNREELLQYGYDENLTVEIPLLVDLERITPQHSTTQDTPRPLNLLFVGRVMPHKNQLALVETMAELLRHAESPVHLYIVGGFTVPEYHQQLQQRIEQLGLSQHITITGKVDDQSLNDLYRRSDIFICLSKHEGFGMPIIEAMAHGLPVLAYEAPASNIRHTLDGAGLLLDSFEPKQCAAAIRELINNPALRRHLKRQGAQRLQEFNYQNLYDRLRDYLAQFDIRLPAHRFTPPAQSTPVDYRIEGPFDSSYSLALVNRELARALRDAGNSVALRATEGPGPIEADRQFLDANPDCAQMHALHSQDATHVLRLLYPPRVTDMHGDLNVMSCYGWEESCLPEHYCNDFNQHLHLITSMSSWVTRTLHDNGVTTPVTTVGLGADHILRSPIEAKALPAMASLKKPCLKLLHISSCFPRKGVDVLLKAYGAAFTAYDAVVLIIKTFPNPHHDIEQQLADWRRTHPNPPRIELINADLPEGAIRALYTLADVLVAPSRGEGFGLPMAEAMLHQCPVITTGHGGQRDFCTPETAWLIDYSYSRADSHFQTGPSVWAEPSAEHLSELLMAFHQAWHNGRLSQLTEQRTAAAEALIKQRYLWRHVAEASKQAIRQASQQPLLKPAARLGCISTWNTACGIATYTQKLLEPAFGQNCTIFANHDQPLTPDLHNVTRCWHAGGEDDLSQLRQAIEQAGVDTLLVQFNFSFFALPAFAQLLQWAHGQGIRTLATFHSTADVRHGDSLKTLRDLAQPLSACTRLLVHSVADLNRLHGFGLQDNLLLFPHGVIELPPPQPGPQQRASGLQDKIVIASYGFLLPHKGIPELIEAFSQLAREDDRLHLLLVNAQYPVAASADLAAACRARIQAPDLAGRVTLISDYLEDQQSLAWLSLAHCIVFPYQHTQESSSAAVRWGLATGKPVLCTPLDIFEDVSEAVTFLPGCDISALAQGLRSNLQQPLHARQQGWLRTHAWSRISSRLRNLLNALH